MKGRTPRQPRGDDGPPLDAAAPWRPVAYLAIADRALRARLRDRLRPLGWAVVDSSVAQHLLQTLAGPLRRDEPWLRPGLVVIDSPAACGSAHATARELRAVAPDLPIVVVVPGSPVGADDPAPGIHRVDPAIACEVVIDLARRAARGKEAPS